MTATATLLLVRHAIALDRGEARREGIDDADRPLTAKGEARMRLVAAGLRSLVPALDVIVTSPCRRASETADLLAERYPGASRETLDILAPGGDPEAVLADRRGRPRHATIALVGHEPDLGELASTSLAGATGSFIPLKKGGCCLIGFPGKVRAAQAQLLWSLPPKVLRALAERR